MRHYLKLSCHHAGCKEWSFHEYSSKKEHSAAVKRGVGKDWKCIVHNDDRTLGPDKLTLTKTFVNMKSKNYPGLEGLFWNGTGGFQYGAGWKALSKDFPEGTQIIETVQVILPKDTL